MGFGGVLPWARWMLVEQRRWLTADEFAEVRSLGQFLPGGNVVNVSVVVGSRLAGPKGAIAALGGLLAGPVALVILLGALYVRYQDAPEVRGALAGLTAAAVGLVAAMAIKMLQPLAEKRDIVALVLVLLTFVAVGILRAPLPLAVLALASLGTALAWRRIP